MFGIPGEMLVDDGGNAIDVDHHQLIGDRDFPVFDFVVKQPHRNFEDTTLFEAVAGCGLEVVHQFRDFLGKGIIVAAALQHLHIRIVITVAPHYPHDHVQDNVRIADGFGCAIAVVVPVHMLEGFDTLVQLVQFECRQVRQSMGDLMHVGRHRGQPDLRPFQSKMAL